jgi:tellurite resistance protein TerC
MLNEEWMIAVFVIFVVFLLILDLKVINRKAHVIKVKEALGWTAFWISLALAFNVGVYFFFGYNEGYEKGYEKAMEFLAAYLVEKSLSMDNLFVFLMLFTYFGVSPLYQHKVLFWGIIGALIMRAFFIFAGVALIQKFHWIIYVFGAFLIYTGIKLAIEKEKEIHPEKNPILKLFRRFVNVTPEFVGGKFFIRKDGRSWATPLFVVLIVIETTDVIFAVDSIPAVLAISHDPFIVYASNVMAILGLRALYFALAGLMHLFRFLNYGLAIILSFVGVKMLISDFYKMPIGLALGFIGIILAVSIILSVLIPKKDVDESEITGEGKAKKPAGSK